MKRHISIYNYHPKRLTPRLEVTIYRNDKARTYYPLGKSMDRLGEFMIKNDITSPSVHVARSGIGMWFDWDK